MSEFTAHANIKNFKAQLMTSTEKAQKTMLRQLLNEERQILAELVAERHCASSLD